MSTKKIADFVVATRFSNLPSNIIARARLVVRDNLGVMLAANKDRAVKAARRVATAMGGREESTLIGVGIKVPCNIASWVNAVMGSTLDMDDGAMGPEGHLCHPGGVVVPSCLAVGELQNSTGKELIEAVVVGCEIALRTGWMTGMMGQRLGGSIGVYGAAAAAAKLLKLSPKGIISALGIAEAHRPDPSSETIWEKPAMTKEAMGWAAMTGVTAALLAKEGFGGPRTIYDLQQYSRIPLETLGNEWEILRLYFKPYATCRCGHTALDGVLELIKEHNLKADNISKITIGVSSTMKKMVNCPPVTIWEAQYSIPFAVGCALVDEEVGLEQITESRLRDEAILTQAKKVELVVDPEADTLYPKEYAARAKIEMKDGKHLQIFKRYPRGDPQNPLSKEELEGKFRKLATKAIGVDRTKDLSKCLDRLEECGINELIEKISQNELVQIDG